MQGYVLVNNMYVHVLENLEAKVYESCGMKQSEGSGDMWKDRLYEFHSDRIQSTMD